MGRAGFEARLESLRGMAAFIVAAHHGMCAFGYPRETHIPILTTTTDWLLWITNPAASVVFFFVLSGYVLGRSLERNGNIPAYLLRRAFRILPMFVLSVLFAYACVTLVRINPQPIDVTEFFKRLFWPVPTATQLWDNLILRSSWINGPSWSIWPEILGSIFLPFLLIAHRYVPDCWRWPLFIATSTALAFSGYRLVIWFYWGFFLPVEVSRFAQRHWIVQFVVFVVGYILLRHVALGGVIYQMRTVAPTAIGASLMIGAVISSPSFMTWLNAGPFRFIGRVSYSFYLLHWPIFYVTWAGYMQIPLPHGYVGNLLICATSIGMALVLSSVTYAFIELPTIALGKRLSTFGGSKTAIPIEQLN